MCLGMCLGRYLCVCSYALGYVYTKVHGYLYKHVYTGTILTHVSTTHRTSKGHNYIGHKYIYSYATGPQRAGGPHGLYLPGLYRRVLFFKHLGACRRRTPRTRVHLEVHPDASHRDLSDAAPLIRSSPRHYFLRVRLRRCARAQTHARMHALARARTHTHISNGHGNRASREGRWCTRHDTRHAGIGHGILVMVPLVMAY